MSFKLSMTGQEFLQKIKNPQPVNLLDNSDFTNPVNQRGWQGAAGPTQEMCIDRYYCALDEGNSLTLTSEGLIATGNAALQIRLEKGILKENTVYTRITYFADGNIKVATDAIRMERDDFDYVSWGIGEGYYGEQGKSAIKAIGLYKGEYSINTAPKYQSKGYATELLECQRYFLRVNNVITPCYGVTMNNQTGGYVTLPTSVEMRTTPTITVSNLG